MRDGTWNPELPLPMTIREVRQETPAVRRFVLDGSLTAEPGQFVMVWLPGIDEKPFSLMNAQPVTLAVAEVGRFTRAMHQLSQGDRLWLRGPFGQGFTLEGRHLLLAAGGYGAAPLAFLARRARGEGRRVAVLVAARSRQHLLLVDEFRTLGCEVYTCTDDGSDSQPPRLAPQAVEELLTSLRPDALYACGPAGMLDALEALARQYHLPAQLSREAYMRCGIGVCGSCTCGDQLVCRDGPVFRIPG